jgi:hypothetical protein
MSRGQVLRTCTRRSSNGCGFLRSRHLTSRRRLGHLPRSQTPRARVHSPGRSADHGTDRLKVQVPFTARDIVSVTHVAPRHRGLSAEVTVLGHSCSSFDRVAPVKSAASYNEEARAPKSPEPRKEVSAFEAARDLRLGARNTPASALNLDRRKTFCYFHPQPKYPKVKAQTV